MTLRPAPAGAGVIFWKGGDGPSAVKRPGDLVAANPSSVSNADHGTTLSNGRGFTVATVEHLMAALALTGVDDTHIEIDGPEVPILDGSAMPFVDAIVDAGVRELDRAREEIRFAEAMEIIDGDRSVRIEPADRFTLAVGIDFADCMIGRQRVEIDLGDETRLAALASARTFCRLSEVDALQRAGFIRGGSFENAVVVDGERVLNGDGLRDPEEFALHKALDLLGDLALLGAPLGAKVTAIRPGHDINCRAGLAVQRALVREQAAESA